MLHLLLNSTLIKAFTISEPKVNYLKSVSHSKILGVTTISVDPHKFGLSPKGVSVVLFRDRSLLLGSIFSYTEWPGGIYTTPTHAGSRGCAPIAGAWVALQAVGMTGYEDKAGKVIEATKRCAEKLSEVKSIQVIGKPEVRLKSK